MASGKPQASTNTTLVPWQNQYDTTLHEFTDSRPPPLVGFDCLRCAKESLPYAAEVCCDVCAGPEVGTPDALLRPRCG
jgi:hypothetical protein